MSNFANIIKKGKQAGWVKKEDKKLVQRNVKDWIVDTDSIWKPLAEVMAGRGYVKIGDKWIKATPEDLEVMKKWKELTGDELVAVTSKHIHLYVQGYPPEKVAEVLVATLPD